MVPVLSKRLFAIANEINFSTMADIGTDHAWVPIYCVLTDKTHKAIASDINKGPLLRAEKNIALYGCSDKIQLRLGNGLEPVKENEVEAIVLSGMGGMLVIEILQNSPTVTASVSQLVLQPQLDAHRVRRYLHTIGFKIVNEVMVQEDSKFYTVINAEKGKDKPYSEVEYYLGKYDINQDYLQQELLRLEEVYRRIVAAPERNQAAGLRLAEVEALIGYFKERLR